MAERLKCHASWLHQAVVVLGLRATPAADSSCDTIIHTRSLLVLLRVCARLTVFAACLLHPRCTPSRTAEAGQPGPSTCRVRLMLCPLCCPNCIHICVHPVLKRIWSASTLPVARMSGACHQGWQRLQHQASRPRPSTCRVRSMHCLLRCLNSIHICVHPVLELIWSASTLPLALISGARHQEWMQLQHHASRPPAKQWSCQARAPSLC
jgi:hypothetical protein